VLQSWRLASGLPPRGQHLVPRVVPTAPRVVPTGATASCRAVDWVWVCDRVADMLSPARGLAWPGTIDWLRSSDDDKLAACLVSSVVWAFNQTVAQEQRHDADVAIMSADPSVSLIRRRFRDFNQRRSA